MLDIKQQANRTSVALKKTATEGFCLLF